MKPLPGAVAIAAEPVVAGVWWYQGDAAAGERSKPPASPGNTTGLS